MTIKEIYYSNAAAYIQIELERIENVENRYVNSN